MSVFVLTNDLWKGVLVKHHQKVFSILARLYHLFWYLIIWSRISRVIPVKEAKIVQLMIPSVKWSVLQFTALSHNRLFSWEWCWQLYNPFSILSQINCHLDSRGWEGCGMRTCSTLFISGISSVWIFSQYTRIKRLFKWVGWTFDLLPSSLPENSVFHVGKLDEVDLEPGFNLI